MPFSPSNVARRARATFVRIQRYGLCTVRKSASQKRRRVASVARVLTLVPSFALLRRRRLSAYARAALSPAIARSDVRRRRAIAGDASSGAFRACSLRHRRAPLLEREIRRPRLRFCPRHRRLLPHARVNLSCASRSRRIEKFTHRARVHRAARARSTSRAEPCGRARGRARAREGGLSRFTTHVVDSKRDQKYPRVAQIYLCARGRRTRAVRTWTRASRRVVQPFSRTRRRRYSLYSLYEPWRRGWERSDRRDRDRDRARRRRAWDRRARRRAETPSP